MKAVTFITHEGIIYSSVYLDILVSYVNQFLPTKAYPWCVLSFIGCHGFEQPKKMTLNLE